MPFLASYFVGYLSEWILRTRIPIILFCLPGIWGWRACCASGRRAASTTAWFVGRAGAWGERGGGAGRIIVLDDPGGAFAVRWVLARSHLRNVPGWGGQTRMCLGGGGVLRAARVLLGMGGGGRFGGWAGSITCRLRTPGDRSCSIHRAYNRRKLGTFLSQGSGSILRDFG